MTQVLQNLFYSPSYNLQRLPSNKNVTPNRTAIFMRSYSWRRPFASSTFVPSSASTRSSHSSIILKNIKEEVKARIRKLFDGVDLSISSYDTAWVAMVPDPQSSGPLFPECVDWVMRNQVEDGSWSLPHHNPKLIKDVLSSTLACVLALMKWGIADDQVQKGVGFIERNFASVSDDHDELLVSPIAFDIIFPGMLEYGQDLGLDLHPDTTILSDLLRKRNFMIRSFSESNSEESKEYLAYISEGMFKLQNWDMAMKFQRKNGSLLNSLSATAAAAIHLKDPDCINYLKLVTEKFGPSVPAVYPLDIYLRLCLVDNLERLGIHRYFKEEIQNVLDDTYRCWQQEDEEIFAEASTCAIAFQLLRNHGYDISTDQLMKFVPENNLENCFGGYWRNERTMLELYRASELIIDQNEAALEKIFIWSKNLLMKYQNSSDCNFFRRFNSQLHNEVENILQRPSYATLEWVANKSFIEEYDIDNIRILKTSFCSANFSNKDLQNLAIQDFNALQNLYLQELKQLQRWVMENRFGELKFTMDVTAYAYFSAATTICSPELSDARLFFAKHSIVVTAIDDFFDGGGSIEELKHFIQLVEKWDESACNGSSSEPVRILFSALYNTVISTGIKAFKLQERDVTGHIVEMYLKCLYAELKEVEWATKLSNPTSLDEYMEISTDSFGYDQIICSTAYLVCPKLSDEVVRSPEMNSLCKCVATCARILNDIQASEREMKSGKKNYFSVRASQGDHRITKEDVVAEMRSINDESRTELLRLVVQEKGSVVPRACKDLFWDASQIVHLFYHTCDGYRTQEMHKLVKSILHEPLKESKVGERVHKLMNIENEC